MVMVGLLIASSLAVLLATPSVFAGSTSPIIGSAAFSVSSGTYTVTVNGTGFGNLPKSLPFTGDTGYFRIGDAAQTGSSEWGYNGDGKTLTYDSWTDTQVVVSGFGGSPGDAIIIALWNPTTGVGVTWGGNVPPIPKAPQITSVEFSGSGETTSMTIVGSGFGGAPVSMPFTGDLNYFHFLDFRAPCGSSSEFGAGFNGWGIVTAESVTVTFQSWSNNLIQISGFDGTYGQGCATAILGDPVSIDIWSASDSAVTGPQTAWGGILSTTTPVTTTTTTTQSTTTTTTATVIQTLVSTTSLISTTTSATTTTATITSPTTTTTTSTSPTTTTMTLSTTLVSTSTYSMTETVSMTSTTTLTPAPSFFTITTTIPTTITSYYTTTSFQPTIATSSVTSTQPTTLTALTTQFLTTTTTAPTPFSTFAGIVGIILIAALAFAFGWAARHSRIGEKRMIAAFGLFMAVAVLTFLFLMGLIDQTAYVPALASFIVAMVLDIFIAPPRETERVAQG